MSCIPEMTFSMDPDEEKQILYEKTEVWVFLGFHPAFLLQRVDFLVGLNFFYQFICCILFLERLPIMSLNLEEGI